MKKTLTITLIALFFISCGHKTSNDFLSHFSQYCGQSFAGKTVFPDDPEHDFAGKKLIMTIAECSEKEIRVPFQVGENTSRTWIITRTNKGLLLKHDHRHEDGTPDEVTMYGGYEDQASTALKVNFAADEATATMLPEASTNVWTLSFDKDNKHFIYSLTRHNQPRYEAIFDLTQ
jgi:hypothetical protein